MARVTNAQILASLTALNARLDALEQTPAKGAPASAKAESPFLTFIHERAAAKVACTIHPASACNRKFSPKSSGREGHVARLV